MNQTPRYTLERQDERASRSQVHCPPIGCVLKGVWT